MIPQEKLSRVIDEIIASAKKLPIGFCESHIGMELPGTRGWGLSINVSAHLKEPICIWERPRSWDCSGERLWLTGFNLEPERHMREFIHKEAAAIALIKAAPTLIEWIENVARDYMI